MPKKASAKKQMTRARNINISQEKSERVEDRSILNMTKALTVSALNQMFSDRVDIFEYAQERDDWKFPRYVKI